MGVCIDPFDCDYESMGYQWALSEATHPLAGNRRGAPFDWPLIPLICKVAETHKKIWRR
jgi:hypothetical protein